MSLYPPSDLLPEESSDVRSVETAKSAAPSTRRGSRWIDNWNPENETFWEATGRKIARRNLNWSIFAEFLGFAVWQLWSVVVTFLPQAGFAFTQDQLFWLVAIPSLVGATLRIPYTLAVPVFGGRNWTVISALLLLIPAVGLIVVTNNPDTPFGVMVAIAALAGFGGGNFASSMTNITFFFPAKEKGWALGLNAAGGNLGAAAVQLVVPLVVTIGAGITLDRAGLIWIPLILLAAYAAWRRMDNLSTARNDVAGSLAAAKEGHLWLMAVLYIGTFGSFIGFSAAFPLLIKSTFPEVSVGHFAFLGALVGSLARPYGGRLADKIGGARLAVISFLAMSLGALGVVWSLPLHNFGLFLMMFLFLFVASGIGNGATYRMIPAIFRTLSVRRRENAEQSAVTARKAAAALGIVSAVGAYGGFLVPRGFALSTSHTGSLNAAFYVFVAFYLCCTAAVWFAYLRPGTDMAAAKV